MHKIDTDNEETLDLIHLRKPEPKVQMSIYLKNYSNLILVAVA
jgi:hypothetical protein